MSDIRVSIGIEKPVDDVKEGSASISGGLDWNKRQFGYEGLGLIYFPTKSQRVVLNLPTARLSMTTG